MTAQTFLPGPAHNTVRTHAGQILPVPHGWELLTPSDAALTRRVKAAGEHWLVQERVGRKVFSRGVWAPAATIAEVRSELAAERSTDAYAKKQAAGDKRRVKGQRREVRRMLAQRSKELLGTYRRGEPTGIACPLARALASCESAAGSEESTGLG